MATETKPPAWRADVPVPDAIALLIERVRTAIGAMNAAPPMDGGGTYEQRRAHAAAQHLEFEIAPLVGDELDAAAIVQAIADAAVAQFIRAIAPLTSGRQTMPLNSSRRCLPGERVQIVARPQAALHVERIIIPDAVAANFMIHDIRVGNNSQLSQAGPLPADAFAASVVDAIDTFVDFEAIQTSMDFTVVVEYVGGNREGEVFNAAMLGTVDAAIVPDQHVRDQLLLAAKRQRQRDGQQMTAEQQSALLGAWQQIVGTGAV
jgi:hypothetical protein